VAAVSVVVWGFDAGARSGGLAITVRAVASVAKAFGAGEG